MTRRHLVACQTMSWIMHFQKTLTLAVPLALGQLMSIGINTADIIALGQLSTHDLAAGSLAARYFQPFFFMGMGLMLAVGPLVAQGLGGNNDRLVRRSLRQGLFLAVAVGVVFWLRRRHLHQTGGGAASLQPVFSSSTVGTSETDYNALTDCA